MLIALALTLWTVYCVYDRLGPTLIYASRPLIAGSVAGLIVGDLTLGMAIGGTLELAFLGVYTYGGATIPDFTTGAIIGTALAAVSPGDLTHQLAIGIGLGTPAALLLTALDPVGRFLPVFWMHRADRAAMAGRTRELTLLHWTAFVPWAAVRAVPTFLAAYFLDSTLVTSVEDSIPEWFTNGMALVGAILPAVGFAMLLKLLPVARYWYMLLIGYVLYGYMHVSLIGIALFGIAIAVIFVTLAPRNQAGPGAGPGRGTGSPPPVTNTAGKPPRASAGPPEEPPRTTLGRRALYRAFWRYFWSFQISWNYERMQALGFCWAMTPVLRSLHKDDDEFRDALRRHLVFFNTSPIVGGPLILGTTIAMEESGSQASADGVKVATMGPMAGIGDTITFALYNSIIFTICANWAIQGKVIGPVVAAVLVLVPYFVARRWQFAWGYKQGKNLAARIRTGALEKVNEGATILGLIVLGGFIPSIVHMVTTLTYTQHVDATTTTGATESVTQTVQVQDQIDQILPYLLPVALTALIYAILRKFDLNPIWAIVIVFVIGLALGGLGWFAPELPKAGG